MYLCDSRALDAVTSPAQSVRLHAGHMNELQTVPPALAARQQHCCVGQVYIQTCWRASKLLLMHGVSNKFTWHHRQPADETEMMQHPAADAITVASHTQLHTLPISVLEPLEADD